MEMQDLTTLIGNFGFPIVITFYILNTMNKTMKDLTDSVNLLRSAIEKKEK